MKKAQKILVGLKSAEHCATLLDIGCRNAASHATLMLVHVVEIPPADPIDTEIPGEEEAAKEMFQLGRRMARSRGMKVKTLILHARSAGEALLDLLKENRADLAVIGYQHRGYVGELLLGSTARYLARHAPCQILVSIPPRTEEAAAT